MKRSREPFWSLWGIYIHSVTIMTSNRYLFNPHCLHLVYNPHDILLWNATEFCCWELFRVCLRMCNVNCRFSRKTLLDIAILDMNPKYIAELLIAGADIRLIHDDSAEVLGSHHRMSTVQLVSKTLTERQLSMALDGAVLQLRTRIVKYLLGMGATSDDIRCVDDYNRLRPDVDPKDRKHRKKKKESK